MKRVIRTERFWIKPNKSLSKLCHLSKNLYNETNYLIRQAYFNTENWVRTSEFKSQLITSSNFSSLPLPTAERILQLVDIAWKSFFRASTDWKTHPEKYFQKPRIPKYKEKSGRFILPFAKSQIYFVENDVVLPSITGIRIKTRIHSKNQILGARIVPKGVGYVLELMYVKYIPVIQQKAPKNVVGIDIGVVNLITMVNNIGKNPITVKGGVTKSINQYYNKERARLQSTYDRQEIKIGKQILKLNDKRNRKIYNFFHEVSRFIIEWCFNNKIDTIIMGRNKNWKQRIKLGKKTNQNFISIPFYRLIGMITYKAQDVGIRVIQVREDYTSKCSFLDNEPIRKRSKYEGERVARGLYRSKNGIFINSDVNGAYNIIKKEVPNAFSQKVTVDGIEDVGLHPVRWKANGQPVAC